MGSTGLSVIESKGSCSEVEMIEKVNGSRGSVQVETT